MKLGDGLSMPVGVSWWRRFASRFDWPLFTLIGLVVGIGLANLYSATHGTAHSGKFDQQLVRMFVSALLFAGASAFDYRNLQRFVWFGLGAAVVVLVAVAVVGHVAGGAGRWLNLAGVRLQPSEFAKIAVILILARIVQDHRSGEARTGASLVFVMFALVPIGLIAMQPDLGSAIVVGLIAASIGVAALPRLWPLLSLGAFGLALLPVLWEHMHAYQKQRWLTFLDPSADPTGAGWHTQQSIFAVGSGQVTGKGYLNATQNQFSFLPEHWTDFPFSVWAEEWGFIGATVLLVLFVALIFWILHLALNARDEFGSMICVGVAAMLFWQLVINVAMVLGLAPVVGVPLPLISYGGSSLMATFLGLGLVSSVAMRRHGF
jgi:rod shape determining protein RodA